MTINPLVFEKNSLTNLLKSGRIHLSVVFVENNTMRDTASQLIVQPDLHPAIVISHTFYCGVIRCFG